MAVAGARCKALNTMAKAGKTRKRVGRSERCGKRKGNKVMGLSNSEVEEVVRGGAAARMRELRWVVRRREWGASKGAWPACSKYAHANMKRKPRSETFRFGIGLARTSADDPDHVQQVPGARPAHIVVDRGHVVGRKRVDGDDRVGFEPFERVGGGEQDG